MIRFIIIVIILFLYLILGIPVLGIEWLIGKFNNRRKIINVFAWYRRHFA